MSFRSIYLDEFHNLFDIIKKTFSGIMLVNFENYSEHLN
jgi:hypothetical protein